jgi:hypothetical protein
MDFWVLLMDEDPLGAKVTLDPAVQRFVGYDDELALCIFTSVERLRAFVETMDLEAKFFEGEEGPLLSPEEVGKVFYPSHLSEVMGRLKAGLVTQEELAGFIEGVESVSYVAVDPDTDSQQVWDIDRFEDYLEGLG